MLAFLVILVSFCSSQDVDVILTNAQYVKLGLQVREMLCHICDHAHDRAVKLLVARGRVRRHFVFGSPFDLDLL